MAKPADYTRVYSKLVRYCLNWKGSGITVGSARGAQAAHGFAHPLYRAVDLFEGGVTPQRKPQCAVRKHGIDTERAQHIRRFQAGRGAGRTCGNSEILQRQQQRLAIDAAKTDIEI